MSAFDFEPHEHFWRKDTTPGPLGRFPTPEDMYRAALAAFEHLEAHPHREEVLFHNKGTVVRTFRTRIRPYTFTGLALRMGCTSQTLKNYRSVPGFAEVLTWIEEVIHTQKFEAAAADMLNANFIARDLGMADKRELTGRDGGPLQTQDVTDEEALKDEARRLGIPLGAFGLGGGEEEES